jgi:hypothetical protein
MTELRTIADPFIAALAPGVCGRDRLTGLTPADVDVLRLIGAHLGSLRTRSVPPGYGVNTADQCAQDRSGHAAEQRILATEPAPAQFLGTVRE